MTISAFVAFKSHLCVTKSLRLSQQQQQHSGTATITLLLHYAFHVPDSIETVLNDVFFIHFGHNIIFVGSKVDKMLQNYSSPIFRPNRRFTVPRIASNVLRSNVNRWWQILLYVVQPIYNRGTGRGVEERLTTKDTKYVLNIIKKPPSNEITTLNVPSMKIVFVRSEISDLQQK